jgi:hypothetical protein
MQRSKIAAYSLTVPSALLSASLVTERHSGFVSLSRVVVSILSGCLAPAAQGRKERHAATTAVCVACSKHAGRTFPSVRISSPH